MKNKITTNKHTVMLAISTGICSSNWQLYLTLFWTSNSYQLIISVWLKMFFGAW